MSDSLAPETAEISHPSPHHPPSIVTTVVDPTTGQPPILITPASNDILVSPVSPGPISATNVHIPPTNEAETEAADAEEASSALSASDLPADKVNLTLLLVSGMRKTFTFEAKNTIAEVKAWVFDHWPREWQDEAPPSAASLKIVHLGRFLEDESTLDSNKIQIGQATVVHLTIKSLAGNEINDRKSKDSAPKCKLCTIL